MQNKVRYQIFVSSTFLDLKDERQVVLNSILRLGHIPAGMELFPAADDDAWSIIQKVIEESDIYLLVIGGKYGSIDEDAGVSYTEKEFDYAVEIKKPIIVLMHENPSQLPVEKSELAPKIRKKLTAFRDKAQTGRHRRTWLDAKDLRAEVAYSVPAVIASGNLVGWTRADGVDNNELLKQIAEMQQRMQKLEDENAAMKSAMQDNSPLDGESTLDDKLDFDLVEYLHGYGEPSTIRTVGQDSFTVRRVFMALGDFLSISCPEHEIRGYIAAIAAQGEDISEPSFSRLKLKLMALQLIEVREKESPWANGTQSGVNYIEAWTFSKYGQQLWIKERAKGSGLSTPPKRRIE